MRDDEDTYEAGAAQGKSRALYAPDGEPWCRFGLGLECLNECRCLNPNHGRRRAAEIEPDL